MFATQEVEPGPSRGSKDYKFSDVWTNTLSVMSVTACATILLRYTEIISVLIFWERGTTSPQTGAISSSKARGFEKGLNLALCWKGQHIVLKSTTHCAEKHNTLCWKAQRTVLKSTTHRAEKHNALCWKAQRTVLKSTTHCAEKHNTLCWKAQHTVLKSTNSLWWQALLLVLGHCMSFVLMIVVQAAKHEAGTSPTGASSASKARDFILGWLKDANKTQDFFAEKAPPWLFFKKMMFQLVSFLKLRRCMTVILPFCVHTHLMQSPPFVKGAAPKSSSATQWVLMRGLIFFTTCCNLDFFVRKKTIREEIKDEDSWQVPSPWTLHYLILGSIFQDAGSTMVPLPKKKKEHPTEEKVKAW